MKKTLRETPPDATHGSTRTMARAVGPYLNPPEHAPVLSADEKSRIQALEPAGAEPSAQAFLRTKGADTIIREYERVRGNLSSRAEH